jgi:hypothetical protein
MSTTTIWTTELVKESLDKLRLGIQVDLSAFFERDIELKNSNVLFKLTPDEVEEFNKCSQDIIYFVEKYCRFLTDKGRRTVKLTNYQKKLLKSLTDEIYIESLDEYGPLNRNVALMQARQSYKCLFGAEIVIINNNKKLTIPINLLYYFNKDNLTYIEKIKLFLMILYYKIDKW